MPLSATPVLLAVSRSWQWWEYLKPFGLFHLVTVVIVARTVRRLRKRGVELRGTPEFDPYRRKIGWTIFIMQVIADLVQYRQADGIATSLPLQLCDFAAYGAAAMMLFRPRWLCPIMFFWGFGLCTQAFVTPSVRTGFFYYSYWYYWGIHGGIVLAAGWAVSVEGFRPRLRTVGFAALMLATYALGAMAVDEFLGANYGFAGRTTPKFKTLVQKLGPWPGRVFKMYAMSVGTFFFLWGGYVWLNRRKNARVTAETPALAEVFAETDADEAPDVVGT